MGLNRWGVGDCGSDCGDGDSTNRGCKSDVPGCAVSVPVKDAPPGGSGVMTIPGLEYVGTANPWVPSLPTCPCGGALDPLFYDGDGNQIIFRASVVATRVLVEMHGGVITGVSYAVDCEYTGIEVMEPFLDPAGAIENPPPGYSCGPFGFGSATIVDGRVCLNPDGGVVRCPSGAPTKSMQVCFVTCDGEPLVGAAVNASSDDPSGPFAWPIVDPETDPPLTDEDGCVTVAVPLGLAGDAPISITVTALPEYKPTTVTTTYDEQGSAGPIAADVADGYTCCDLDFRKGPTNPSAAPYTPRGTTLFFITSGGDPGTIIVDCDGTACALSDEIEPTGGAPTVETCPPGDFSDGPWDHWTPPTLTADRVPMVVRVWYDGTDYHCSVTVIGTKARPPLGGCNIDPTQQLADFYGWIRSDASCDENDDPKLSVDPDPTLTYPIGVDPDGGSWYSGSTTPITVEASSYTVNANNPVDITFHFDPVAVPVHGGTANISIVDSITVWQPPPPTP